jgi:ADP-ribosylglycohydrolase
MTNVKQRASGCLFGLALGDALGAKTEFLSVSDILQKFPPDGPQEPAGYPALVTDDTQMALAVGEALLLAQRPYEVMTLEPVLRQAFIAWSKSPDNTRAPGMTCMPACEHLAQGLPLGPLWQRASVSSPTEFIVRGWDECLVALDRLDAALQVMDRGSDPCQATGAGWIAGEAFATGLLCFLMYLDDPVAAIRRAAVTSGDSDSIACLTGAFAGSHLGLAAWPLDWIQRIEYLERLAKLGSVWDHFV